MNEPIRSKHISIWLESEGIPRSRNTKNELKLFVYSIGIWSSECSKSNKHRNINCNIFSDVVVFLMSGVVFSPSLLSIRVFALTLPSTRGKFCKACNMEIKRTSVWILINIRKLEPVTSNLVWALPVALFMVLNSLEEVHKGDNFANLF